MTLEEFVEMQADTETVHGGGSWSTGRRCLSDLDQYQSSGQSCCPTILILPSDSLTWKWTMGPWKTTVLYKQAFFHVHVSESECSWFSWLCCFCFLCRKLLPRSHSESLSLPPQCVAAHPSAFLQSLPSPLLGNLQT